MGRGTLKKATLSDLVKLVARETGYPQKEAMVICDELIETMVDQLDQGVDLHLRRLGKIQWEFSPGAAYKDVRTGRRRRYPDGRKLRFKASLRLRKRRS